MNHYKLFTIITALLTILFLPMVTFAQGETEEVDRELIKQKLKERLDEVNGNEDASTGAKLAASNETTYFAYYGIIEEATGSSMLIKTEADATKKVSLAKDVEINLLAKSRTTVIKAADIETGQFVIAMGTMGANKTLNATRISISVPPEEQTKRLVLYGKITEIDSDTINLSNESNFQIELPKSYKLLLQGVDDPELDDISINDKAVVIVMSEPDEEDATKTIYTLKSMYVSPSINNPLAETNKIIEETPSDNEATESAKEDK